MEFLDIEKLYFVVFFLNDIVSDLKRLRCLLYIEEDGVNIFERILMYFTVKYVNRKKLFFLCVFKIKRFKVDFEE